MRKLLGLAVIALGVLWGCNSSASSTPEGDKKAEAKQSSDFKVALITPGAVNDSGWSAMAYEGLKATESELGAEVSNSVANGNDIKDSMRSYAQKGYKLVFGHGFEYNQPGNEVAKDFPDTVFVSSSGSLTSKNSGAIRFYLEQSFYMAGVLAASISKTNVVGMVGGPEVPSIKSTFKAFKAGAEATKPGITVLEAFTGKNDDVAAAKQVAEQMIGKKADVLIHQANSAAQGVFNAAKEGNVLAIGANLNQNDNESGVVVGSATISAKAAFLEVAKLVKEGKFAGDVVEVGMDKGAIDFVFNDKLADKISPEAKAKVAAAKQGLLDGKIVAPKDKF